MLLSKTCVEFVIKVVKIGLMWDISLDTSIHVEDGDCLDAFTVMVKDFTVFRVWIVASENTTFPAVVLKKS